LPEVEFVQFDATRIPYYQEFDAVGAFDVLEHIEEDEKVMLGVHKALKNHGFFLISVPQYRWMWSIEDVRDCHKRRYTRKELVNKLASTNFQVLYVGLFVFMLFPLMLILRLIKRWRKTVQPSNKVALELDLPLILNRVFEFLMRIDEFLIKRGFSLPFGGSVIAVARKGSLVGTRT
jgi:SAM-dependent methyltransferase